MILGQIQVLKQVLRNENLKICWSGIWTMSLIRDPSIAWCELVRDFFLLADQFSPSGAWIPVFWYVSRFVGVFQLNVASGPVYNFTQSVMKTHNSDFIFENEKLERIEKFENLDTKKSRLWTKSGLVSVMGTCNEEFWQVHCWSRTEDDQGYIDRHFVSY